MSEKACFSVSVRPTVRTDEFGNRTALISRERRDVRSGKLHVLIRSYAFYGFRKKSGSAAHTCAIRA
jgi:hypothetical protein